MSQPVRVASVLSASIALAALAVGPAAACTHGSSGGYGGHASTSSHGGYGDHTSGDHESGDHHGSYGSSGPAEHDTSGYGDSEHASYQQGDQHTHCHHGAPAPSTSGAPSGDHTHHVSGTTPSGPSSAAPAPVSAAPAPASPAPAAPAAVSVAKPEHASEHTSPSHSGGGLWGATPTTSGQTAVATVHTAPAKAEKATKAPAGKRGGGVSVPAASVTAPAGTAIVASPAVPTAIDAGANGSMLSRLVHSPLDLGLVLVGLMLGAAGVLVRLRRTAA